MQKTKDRDWTWSICNIPFQWSCFSQKHLDPIVWQTSVKTTMDYGSILESSELKLMFDSETNIPARKELIFLTQSKKTENGTTVAFPWNEIGTNEKCTNLFWKMSKKQIMSTLYLIPVSNIYHCDTNRPGIISWHLFYFQHKYWGELE